MVEHDTASADRDTDQHTLGQGLVEYALIILLIAIAVFVMVAAFGTQLSSTYNRITASLAL